MKSFPNFKIQEPIPPRGSEPLATGAGPFRPNVAGLICRQVENRVEILLGERCDTPGAWQWPQGGLDEGERPEQGLRRELMEEIAVSQLDVVYQFPFILRYRFPASLAGKFKPYLGQDQLYYIVRLHGEIEPSLDLALTKEFSEIRWFPIEKALDSAVWFKQAVYREALNHAQAKLPQLVL